MTDLGSFIAGMRAKGFTDTQVLDAVEALFAADGLAPVVDVAAERRRAADRDRKRASRLRNSAESADAADPFSPSSLSPKPPIPTTPKPIPPSPPKGGSSPAEQFWLAYPHKVGKRDALAALDRALKRAPFEAIMAGLHRYAAKTDDRPWCNPATWLNQDRWDDAPAAQPAPMARGSPQPAKTPVAAGFHELAQSMRQQDAIRSDQNSGSIHKALPNLSVVSGGGR